MARTSATRLVTGAAGFLGSHLVKELLARGHAVKAVIRSTPLELEHPHLEVVQGDVEDRERMIEFYQRSLAVELLVLESWTVGRV